MTRERSEAFGINREKSTARTEAPASKPLPRFISNYIVCECGHTHPGHYALDAKCAWCSCREYVASTTEAPASCHLTAGEARRLLDYLNAVSFASVGNGTLAKLRRMSEAAK